MSATEAFSKYTLTLDLALKPSHKRRMAVGLIVVLVCLICLAVGLLWWQWAVLIMAAAFVIWRTIAVERLHPKHLVSDKLDGLWLLTMPSSIAPINHHHQIKQHKPAKYSCDGHHSWQDGMRRPTLRPPIASLRMTNATRLAATKLAALNPAPIADTPVIWQGFLQSAKLIHLGFTRVVVLDFFIKIPNKQRLTVAVFDDQTTHFSALSMLARVGI